MRIAGLDVGSKTIGIAISDALKLTAQGLDTIRWNENKITSADEQLKQIFEQYEVSEIVVGFPKNMDGTVGKRGEASLTFQAHLQEKFHLPVHLWDERLTTMAAERVLIDADVSRQKRKKVIDKMAAVMILQNYLDQTL